MPLLRAGVTDNPREILMPRRETVRGAVPGADPGLAAPSLPRAGFPPSPSLITPGKRYAVGINLESQKHHFRARKGCGHVNLLLVIHSEKCINLIRFPPLNK